MAYCAIKVIVFYKRKEGSMKRTKILSSAFIMTMVSFGAFGADEIITGGANTCTVDVLGVSDNNATAKTIATWTPVTYECAPGQYLLETETSVECTTCPIGSYCPGGTYTVESENTGATTCPTTHPNSVAGADADTQCYTACTIDMVAKATAVTGNDYYGTGTDTCGATACETGYHVDGGGIELVEKDPLVPISLTDRGAGFRVVSADGISNYSGTVDAIPADSVKAPNTWAVAYSSGVVYGKASCQPKIDPVLEYIYNNNSALMGGQMSLEDFLTGLEPLAGPVKTEYVKNTFIGYATGAISEEELHKRVFGVFYMEPNANYSTDSTGRYCYCQMDGFTPVGGTKAIVAAPWVFHGDLGSAGSCASFCAFPCAGRLHADDVRNLAIRGVVVGTFDLVESGGICTANTINIDWNPDNNGEHIKNMCTYDGAITLPADPVKPGYTFTGWKLVE